MSPMSTVRFLDRLPTRMTAGIVAVLVLLIGLFVHDFTRRDFERQRHRHLEYAHTLADTLAISVSGWLVARDVAGMQELVDAQRHHGDVVYAMILDRSGRVLAHTDRSRVGQYVQDMAAETSEFSRFGPHTLDVGVPVRMADWPAGWVRLGISLRELREAIDRDRRHGVLYALAATSAGTLIAGVLAHFLTRRIETLARVLSQVRCGARGVRTPPLGRDEVGQLGDGLNAMLDSLQERDEAIRSAGLYSRRLLEAALDPLFVIRRDGVIGDVNSATERILGRSREDLVGSTFADYFTDPAAARRGHERAYAEQQVRDYPLTLRDGQGRLVPVNFHASVYADASGRVAGLFAAARDMSEHQRLLAQARSDAQAKAQLLREVNHRVTNNLASMLGLISHEREHVAEAHRPQVAPVLERLTQRLRGLMFVHRMLSDAHWAPVLIDQLARGVVGAATAVAPVPPALVIGATEERISPRQASALAMVLNELATNTVKHGCAVEKPLIRCDIETLPEETVRIVYSDNGPGFPSAVLERDHANVGLRLIRILVEQSLRGQLRLANEGGARVEMMLRLEDRHRT